MRSRSGTASSSASNARRASARFEQRFDGGVAIGRGGLAAQRVVQPVTQAPAAHGGRAAVEEREQRRAILAAERLGDLEIAPGDGVERDVVGRFLAPQRAHVRQRSALGRARIVEQRAARRDDVRRIGHAEGIEGADFELRLQRGGTAVDVEVPVGPRLHRAVGGGQRMAQGILPAFGNEHFARNDARQFRGQLWKGRTARAQLPGGQHQPREAELAVAPERRRDREQHGIGLRVEQGGVGEGARRDDANHLAFHRSLAGRGIAHLLADRDAFAELHQFGEVLLDRHGRHAGHLHRCATGRAAGGQRDVEQSRGALGIVVEQFVEVAHPVEEQDVRMLRLDAQELLHHRRVAGEVSRSVHGRNVERISSRARGARCR